MGSIQKRGDNAYFLTVSNGFGLNGKRQRFTRTVQAKSDKEAKRLLDSFQAEVDSQTFISAGKMTFEHFAKDWLDKYGKTNLAARTYQTYKEILRLRIIPAFKSFKLDQIKPMHLLQFYENLQEKGIRLDKEKDKGLSERTIKHHHRLISTMLNHAVEWQLIKENPAKRVKPPKVKDVEVSYYDEEQIKTLINKLNGAPTKYMTMIILTIFTGMSRGEIFGLKWEDVNFDEMTISVSRAAQYIRKEGVSLKAPKNKYRKRTISVPEFVIEVLNAHKVIQTEIKLQIEEIYEDNDFIFAQDNGKQMHPDTITKWFKSFITSNNLPPITFHGLRHSHATILIADNTDLLTVSRRLGHNKTSTTVDIYGHSIKKAEKSTSDKLEKLLNVSKKNSEVSSNCHQNNKKASS